MRCIPAVVIVACFASACGTPKLIRHYDSVDGTINSGGHLTLSVFQANPRPFEDPPLLVGLSERGQAELIRSVAARMPADSSADAFMRVLSQAPSAPSGACAWADATSMKKRVTLTVLGHFGRPADRVDRLEFTFSGLDSAQAAFASWDKFDSEYGSFDLGSTKYTQSRKFTLGRTGTDTETLADNAGSVVKMLTAGGEVSDSMEENMKYAIQRMKVGGALEPSRATLVQEGGPYINLIGSSSAVFTMKLVSPETPLPVHALAFEDGKKTPPDAVSVKRCQAKIPAKVTPLSILVGGKALKRQAIAQHDTISEGDDAVHFESQDFDKVPVQLATEQDLTVDFFGLVICPARPGKDACLRLAMENPDDGAIVDTIALQTIDQAAILREWMVWNSTSAAPASIGGRKIGLVHSPHEGGHASATRLTPDLVKTLRIMRVAGTVQQQ